MKKATQVNLNETYDKGSQENSSSATHPPNCNGNIKAAVNGTVTSYDITPARHELPPLDLADEDNYDIADLRSGDETDDEDNPCKKIPKWAKGKRNKYTGILEYPGLLNKVTWVGDCKPDRNIQILFQVTS